jgi:TatD DNase family protein
MKYFDAHCHIQFSPYDEDRGEVVARMKEAEVGGLIVGCDLASSKAAIVLAKDEPTFFAAVGLHPNDTDEEFAAAAFDALAADSANKVRAIGECGLDYYRPDEPESVKRKQKEVFEQHIELAVKYEKPLMIHSRPSKGTQDAYHDTIEMLTAKKKEYGDKLKGDMHFFVGGVDEARAFAELDFTMSYTAVITFSHDYDEVIRFLPMSHILTETDSPYVAPAPNRGKRNEPTAVIQVVKALAAIRGEDEENVRMAVLQNAARIFSFSL